MFPFKSVDGEYLPSVILQIETQGHKEDPKDKTDGTKFKTTLQ